MQVAERCAQTAELPGLQGAPEHPKWLSNSKVRLPRGRLQEKNRVFFCTSCGRGGGVQPFVTLPVCGAGASAGGWPRGLPGGLLPRAVHHLQRCQSIQEARTQGVRTVLFTIVMEE